MSYIKTSIKFTIISLVSSFMFACSQANTSLEAAQSGSELDSSQNIQQLVLDVYKSPTCGCCTKWISHLNENEIETTPHHPNDIYKLKSQLEIQSNYHSCHTAVSPQGYVFEGHIPAKIIKQFLADTPDDVLGLSVPGMPLGSPGMEVGEKFNPYDVLLLHKDGGSSVYARIQNASDQY